jgi:hypothetical protein
MPASDHLPIQKAIPMAKQERSMKRGSSTPSLAVSLLALLPAAVFAQVDTTSDAYAKGHSVGKVFGYIVLAVLVIGVLRKLFKK